MLIRARTVHNVKSLLSKSTGAPFEIHEQRCLMQLDENDPFNSLPFTAGFMDQADVLDSTKIYRLTIDSYKTDKNGTLCLGERLKFEEVPQLKSGKAPA